MSHSLNTTIQFKDYGSLLLAINPMEIQIYKILRIEQYESKIFLIVLNVSEMHVGSLARLGWWVGGA